MHFQGKKASNEGCSGVLSDQGWREELQVISQRTLPCQESEDEVPSSGGCIVYMFGVNHQGLTRKTETPESLYSEGNLL